MPNPPKNPRSMNCFYYERVTLMGVMRFLTPRLYSIHRKKEEISAIAFRRYGVFTEIQKIKNKRVPVVHIEQNVRTG